MSSLCWTPSFWGFCLNHLATSRNEWTCVWIPNIDDMCCLYQYLPISGQVFVNICSHPHDHPYRAMDKVWECIRIPIQRRGSWNTISSPSPGKASMITRIYMYSSPFAWSIPWANMRRSAKVVDGCTWFEHNCDKVSGTYWCSSLPGTWNKSASEASILRTYQ